MKSRSWPIFRAANLKLFWLVFIFTAGTDLRAAVELLNGVAASVGSKIITVRDAQFYRSLQKYREGGTNLFAKESGEDLRRTVQKVALEEMVYLEMKSFRYGSPARAEAEKVIKARRQSDKTNSWARLLKEYQKSETYVVDYLARSLEIEKFLQKKIETLTPVITDAEAERYYRQNASRYPVGDLESNRAQVVRDLKFERMQKSLEDWVQSLREKYKFVNRLPPGAGKG